MPDPKEKTQPEVETKVEPVVEETNDDDDDVSFFDMLGDDDSSDSDSEEDKRRKNKDAEEARKRREAEAKLKADQEAEEKAKAAAEAKAKAEAEEKAKAEAEAAAKSEQSKKDRENKLGEQLVDFKNKYPDVDLVNLDRDENFKRFIDGKLLGKKDFTALYKDYVDLRSALSGKTSAEVAADYARKAQSSSGPAAPRGTAPTQDVFSEAELDQLTQKMPFMSRDALQKIEAKLQRSIEYYEKQK